MVTSLPRRSEGESSDIYLKHHIGHRHQPPDHIRVYSSVLLDPPKGSCNMSPFLLKITYRGVIRLAAPTAKPTKLRPRIIPHTAVDIACHSAPRTNRMSAMIMTGFRPSLSPRIPARGLAISAKRLVEEVIKLLSRVVRPR